MSTVAKDYTLAELMICANAAAYADDGEVLVTGIGVLTSLGQGKEANWTALTSGVSGIHRITRFPTAGMRTTIAATVDFVSVDDMSAPALSERLADLVIQETRQHNADAKKKNPSRRPSSWRRNKKSSN